MEKRGQRIIKKFSSRMQARLLLVFCVISALLAVLIGRLVYIIQTDGERYAKAVLSRESYTSAVLPYKRGDIIDRNGTVLARSELKYRLILDAKKLNLNTEYISSTLMAIEEYFGIPEATVREKLIEKPDSQYLPLANRLSHTQVDDFKAMMKESGSIKGVWFEQEYVRVYPGNTLASDIIGFTATDNVGFYGIEEFYNDELNGTNGREYGYYDSSLNIDRKVKEPVNGNSVITTIDSNIQIIIQKHILDFNMETGSKNIGVLIMNPNNGEIIAMASNKEYDLNNPRSLEGIIPENELSSMTQEDKLLALNELWKNDIISFGFEPGSTFKPITVSIGLEEAIISEEDTFLCDGVEHVGGWDIHCSRKTGHGWLTLGEALMKSCNDAMMQIAAAEGRDIFFKYENEFMFGQKTGIDLPGEAMGIITSLDKLNSSELATASFGQSFNVTMLQMAAAYSSLINGGFYYKPHVVKQIINDKGATIKQYDKLLVKRTVSEETSEFIQNNMYLTVEAGTAKPAKVPGYAVGGKTGTAEKLPRGSKTYIVSFIGAVPAINPEVVIYVMIDEPQNVERQDNSSIATTFASRILTEILPALGIYPEGEIDYLLDDDILEGGEDVGDETGISLGDNNSTDSPEEDSQNNDNDNPQNNDTQNNGNQSGNNGNSNNQNNNSNNSGNNNNGNNSNNNSNNSGNQNSNNQNNDNQNSGSQDSNNPSNETGSQTGDNNHSGGGGGENNNGGNTEEPNSGNGSSGEPIGNNEDDNPDSNNNNEQNNDGGDSGEGNSDNDLPEDNPEEDELQA